MRPEGFDKLAATILPQQLTARLDRQFLVFGQTEFDHLDALMSCKGHCGYQELWYVFQFLRSDDLFNDHVGIVRLGPKHVAWLATEKLSSELESRCVDTARREIAHFLEERNLDAVYRMAWWLFRVAGTEVDELDAAAALRIVGDPSASMTVLEASDLLDASTDGRLDQRCYAWTHP